MSKLKSFSEINSAMESLFPDPSIAETLHFNLFKVYQHALSYTLNQSTEKLFRHYLNWPLSLQISRYAFKGLKRKPRKTIKHTLFYVDPRQGVNDLSKSESFFFSKSFAIAEPGCYSLMQKSGASQQKYDITVEDQVNAGNLALDELEIDLLKDINRLAKEGRKTDLDGFSDYLNSALQLFFELFHRYYTLLKDQGTKRLVFICHYHNESLIAACKVLGIEVIEYQHGLIAQNDIYYVYPKSISAYRERALFPDKIVVFGEFWKTVLMKGYEFTESQIIIGGSTPLLPEIRPREERIEKGNAIFIGTQTWLADEYVAYLNHLLKLLEQRWPHWKCIIKLHPLEREAHKYEHFAALPNCELHKKGDLQPLLEQSKIQISIYSTTLYDAIGLDVMNLSLQNYSSSSDYAAEMVANKVAFPLQFDDDPVERYFELQPRMGELLERDDLYAPFRADVIAALINSTDPS